MNSQESVKATGSLVITVLNEVTKEETVHHFKNIVVNVGKTFIAQSMLKTTTNTPAAMTHMAVGTGTATAAVADTALQTELARVTQGTPTGATFAGTNSGATTSYSATFPAGTGTGALTEAGIFNAATAGTMLCRTVFSVINKGANDSITINWSITIN
jgi:hypothetical protein